MARAEDAGPKVPKITRKGHGEHTRRPDVERLVAQSRAGVAGARGAASLRRPDETLEQLLDRLPGARRRASGG